jgi:glycolate oxidase FAD binding subunit
MSKPAVAPESPELLADLLRDSAFRNKTIALAGNDSKLRMAGPAVDAEVVVSTRGLGRVLQYEPKDLTISVEAGMPFNKLQELLGAERQMIALDPPFAAQATIGGVIASNSSGPLRLGYGTARDLVIGMTFATLEGKLVKTGGMVVKNVAGLDMAKLMIGSFGTLAAITSINFRVHSRPARTMTFLLRAAKLQAVRELRQQIRRSPLQPIAVDLLSPAAAARFSQEAFVVAVRAAGSDAALKRYHRELPQADTLSGSDEAALWSRIREYTAEFLERRPDGVVLRVSSKVDGLAEAMDGIADPFITRLMAGVSYIYLTSWTAAPPILNRLQRLGVPATVQYASHAVRSNYELWPIPAGAAHKSAFDMMKKVKQMFDPHNLLNRNRLYGRI